VQTRIVYIPGLGNKYNGFRKVALKAWQLYGVSATLVPLKWDDSDSFEQKLTLVEGVINQSGLDTRVVVVGESAGATLALHVASLPKVYRVITLCGVAQPSTPISPYLQKKSPALFQATRSLPRTNSYEVYSLRAAVDSVVGKTYSIATGAKAHTIWSIGHLFTIIICLTIAAPLMVAIAKKSKT